MAELMGEVVTQGYSLSSDHALPVPSPSETQQILRNCDAKVTVHKRPYILCFECRIWTPLQQVLEVRHLRIGSWEEESASPHAAWSDQHGA
jgi:hypothetical protein